MGLRELLTNAAELMGRQVLCLNENSSLAEAIDFLVRNRISGVPVVDDRDHPVGVLTLRDIARVVNDEIGTGFPFEELKRVKVRKVMTTPAITVSEGASLSEVLDLFMANQIHRVFVVKSDGKISGVISTFDVIRWIK